MATYTERMQSHITALLAGNGNFGTVYLDSTSALLTAKVNSVTVVTNAVFAGGTTLSTGSNVSNSATYPAGITINGPFTAIKLTSGSVQVTIAEPQ